MRQTTRLETTSLAAAEQIVAHARRTADEELKALRTEDRTVSPGVSPAWRLAREAERELAAIRHLQEEAADTLTLRRNEFERVLLPMRSFRNIMQHAGSVEVCADEVADVLGVLLRDSFRKIGMDEHVDAP